MTEQVTERVEHALDIDGMTCASCARRIEKRLDRIDGVTATVNYATERASVSAPKDVTTDELISAVVQAGYGARRVDGGTKRSDQAAVLKSRVLLSFALAIPVIAVSMVPALQFPAWQWVALVLTAVIVYWCGRSFHAAAFTNLRHGTTTMDTLVSLGTNAAFGWSLFAMIFGHAGAIGLVHEFSLRPGHTDALHNVYFEAAAAIISFLLLGRWIEARSKQEAGAAVRALLEVGAKEATVLRDGREVAIPVGELAVGDEFIVRPGEKVAADGEVADGVSAVDASIITGESLPVEVIPGSRVIGGSVNATGRLVVRASAVGSATQVAQIARLVEQAQTGKAKAQRIADQITSYFVPTVLGLSVVTFILHWSLGDGFTMALTAAIAVLIIACPCALGLATPSALLAGTGRGAELGTIIRGPVALEKARAIDTIVLDKTGTLTTGHMAVLSIEPAPGITDQDLLETAAAVEAGSEHPIARAIVERAGATAVVAERFEGLPGHGIKAVIDDEVVHLGSGRILDQLGLERPATDPNVLGSEVFVVRGPTLLGRIVVGDELKPGARDTVESLRRLGLTPVLLTGDNQRVAAAIADEAGIADVRADVLPQQKAEVVSELQAAGRNVAMVGDGVNDAAGLAQADLGIAMGAGTDAAIAASDITLMRDDLSSIVDAVRLSRATDATIKSNLVWAFLYNVLALPIAAFGLLTPMIAGAAMAFSSVFVVLNSLRLRLFRGERRHD